MLLQNYQKKKEEKERKKLLYIEKFRTTKFQEPLHTFFVENSHFTPSSRMKCAIKW